MLGLQIVEYSSPSDSCDSLSLKRHDRIPAEIWNIHMSDIREKYLIQGCTLDELLHWLSEKKNIQPSRRQLTLQLSKWSFFKKRSYLRPQHQKLSVAGITVKYSYAGDPRLCKKHLMLNDDNRACPFCVFLESSGTRQQITMLFAIPSTRALKSLRSLGLERDAAVCAVACWTQLCSQQINVTDGGFLCPSENSLLALNTVLCTLTSVRALKSCDWLLATIPWRDHLRSLQRTARISFWLGLHAAYRRTGYKSNLIAAASMPLADYRNSLLSTCVDPSVPSTFASHRIHCRDTGYIELIFDDLETRSRLKKNTQPTNQSKIDDTTHTNLSSLLKRFANDESKLAVGQSCCSPTDTTVLVRDLTLFEALTICYEIFYGGHLEQIEGGIISGRALFSRLIENIGKGVCLCSECVPAESMVPCTIRSRAPRLVCDLILHRNSPLANEKWNVPCSVEKSSSPESFVCRDYDAPDSHLQRYMGSDSFMMESTNAISLPELPETQAGDRVSLMEDRQPVNDAQQHAVINLQRKQQQRRARDSHKTHALLNVVSATEHEIASLTTANLKSHTSNFVKPRDPRNVSTAGQRITKPDCKSHVRSADPSGFGVQESTCFQSSSGTPMFDPTLAASASPSQASLASLCAMAKRINKTPSTNAASVSPMSWCAGSECSSLRSMLGVEKSECSSEMRMSSRTRSSREVQSQTCKKSMDYQECWGVSNRIAIGPALFVRG